MSTTKLPHRLAGSAARPNHVALAAAATAVLVFGAAFYGAASGARSVSLAGATASASVTAIHRARRPPPPRPTGGCTAAQRDAQAAAFVKATGASGGGGGGNYMPSACASTSIMGTLQAADPAAGGGLTLVNVGANKGYGVAEVMALWRPDLGVSPASVHADLMAAFPDAAPAEMAGACGDAKEAVPEPKATHVKPDLTVHAVEPLPVNVPLLKRLARLVADARPSPPVRIFVHPGAVGPDADAQLGYDPRDCNQVGRESCQMAPLRPGLTPVTGWTLDTFFEEHGLAVVPDGRRSIFLKIDAEGYDGAVLMNAATGHGSALDAVRMLEFEYHGVGMWGRTPDRVRLEDVVTKLGGAGFDCYLQYGSNLVHLTGTCWTAAYEFFAWSNVLCVRPGDAWADAAAGMAVWKG